MGKGKSILKVLTLSRYNKQMQKEGIIVSRRKFLVHLADY
jgi:hypothetical protein